MEACSKQRFRKWDREQEMLLPPSVREYVSEGHAANMIVAIVQENLDISKVYEGYGGPTGQPPYHPEMMVALLLYAYSRGIYSSRRIAMACEERLDFLAITGREQPDHRTIARFRRDHREALKGLFQQSLELCQAAGMVRLQHVALDGSKMKANATKRKSIRYEKAVREEERLTAKIEHWFATAQEKDATEDAEYGEDRGDEPPKWVSDAEQRRERFRTAKQALERRAQERDREAIEAASKAASEQKKPKGRPRKHPLGTPKGKEQYNRVDPESRIVKSPDGYVQGYNVQIAVDAKEQVIVAQGVTQQAVDVQQLKPMVEAIEEGMKKRPKEVSADAGYCSNGNIALLEEQNIRAYVAVGNGKNPGTGKGPNASGPWIALMGRRLKLGGKRSRYRLRKQVVEPVFGQIKQARGFRQFLTRGVDGVSEEWSLLCTTHNILKLLRYQARQREARA